MPGHKDIQLDWDFFLEKIQEEECILVLGPDAFTDEQGNTFQDKLLEALSLEDNPNIFKYYEEDGFFLFDDHYKRTLACHEIKTFYKSLLPGKMLEQLAQIPFHVLLTVTPDKTLHRAFDMLGYEYQFGYYKKNKDPQPIKTPSRQMPLIYNVFGCVDSEESMILTHNDLYDYFKSIFARRSMPERLKVLLKDIKNILFLGVPFDKWYMQLLLRELHIHQQEYAFIRFAAGQQFGEEVRTLCFDQFRINFIDGDIPGFVNALYDKCRERSMLRKVGEAASSELARARQLIAKGELESALDLIMDYTEDTELEELALQLNGRYSKFKRRIIKSILMNEAKQVQENEILDALLELAKEAESI